MKLCILDKLEKGIRYFWDKMIPIRLSNEFYKINNVVLYKILDIGQTNRKKDKYTRLCNMS